MPYDSDAYILDMSMPKYAFAYIKASEGSSVLLFQKRVFQKRVLGVIKTMRNYLPRTIFCPLPLLPTLLAKFRCSLGRVARHKHQASDIIYELYCTCRINLANFLHKVQS
jgi:hypothetical protein